MRKFAFVFFTSLIVSHTVTAQDILGGVIPESELFFNSGAQTEYDAPYTQQQNNAGEYAFTVPENIVAPYEKQTAQQSASVPQIPKNAKSIPVSQLKQARGTLGNDAANQQGMAVKNIDLSNLSASVVGESEAPVAPAAPAVPAQRVEAPAQAQAMPMAETQSMFQPAMVQTEEIDPEDFGLFTTDMGGFGTALWQDIPAAQIDRVFNKVERAGLKSRAARRVLMRMLLTRADAPIEAMNKHWLAKRVEVLHSLGYVQGAELLLNGAGVENLGLEKFVGMPRVWVENALMVGKTEEACLYVKEHLLNSDDPFWRRALLTCQVLTKDSRGLELSRNMITEENRNAEPFFFSLLDAILDEGEEPMLRPKQKISPLVSVLYVNSGDLLKPNVIPRLPDVLLREVAKNFDLPRTVQIQAAEHLVNRYDVRDDVALLGVLYDKVEFEEKDVKSPSVNSIADSMVDGSLARALLWQAAKDSGLPSTKALALKALWQRAARDQLFYLPSMLTPNLRGLNPQPSLAWIAPDVMQYALFAGRIESANAWWKVLMENHAISQSLQDRKEWMSIAMSFVTGQVDSQNLLTWVQSLSLSNDDVRTGVQRVLSMLEAADISYNPNIWLELEAFSGDTADASGTDAGPLWLRMLGTSLEGQKVGRSLLILLEPFTDFAVADLSTQTMGNVVTGYRFLGLEDDARSFALEAIMPTSDTRP